MSKAFLNSILIDRQEEYEVKKILNVFVLDKVAKSEISTN